MRDPLTSDSRTRLVLLGTAGGPNWWLDDPRCGISCAVAVGGRYYLVDCGHGAGPQIRRAGLGNWRSRMAGPLDALSGIFLTHLHSDHVSDLNNILTTGLANGLGLGGPVQVWGPGDRGALPPAPAGRTPTQVSPDSPTPGTAEMVRTLLATYATDFTDRFFEQGITLPDGYIAGYDVPIPAGFTADPNGDPHPRMSPVTFFEDDRVRVSATLVQHAPIFPALAYRFDTDDGSIVISGDTGPSDNLVELADGADVLAHEVIAGEWVDEEFPEPRNPVTAAIHAHMTGQHTSIQDVGPIAERAGVATLVLHHLVPATWPVERWEEAGKGFSGRLVVGADLDQIGVGA